MINIVLFVQTPKQSVVCNPGSRRFSCAVSGAAHVSSREKKPQVPRVVVCDKLHNCNLSNESSLDLNWLTTRM